VSPGLPAALLLDLDGTLVDSEPLHRAAYRAFFADRGWDAPDLALFTGRRAEDVFARVAGPWSGADPGTLARDVLSFIPAAAVPEALPGSRRLIEAAAALGVPMAVVTSAGPTWVQRALADGLGVLHHVAVVVTRHDVVEGKPDPAGFTLACSRLGVAPPDCAAVEDSPAGIAAARAAGVEDVHALSTTHRADELVASGAVEVHADLEAVAVRLGLTGRG
jgi:mannitol-1-/sugar-/sorbitol-6-phosphatase